MDKQKLLKALAEKGVDVSPFASLELVIEHARRNGLNPEDAVFALEEAVSAPEAAVSPEAAPVSEELPDEPEEQGEQDGEAEKPKRGRKPSKPL